MFWTPRQYVTALCLRVSVNLRMNSRKKIFCPKKKMSTDWLQEIPHYQASYLKKIDSIFVDIVNNIFQSNGPFLFQTEAEIHLAFEGSVEVCFAQYGKKKQKFSLKKCFVKSIQGILLINSVKLSKLISRNFLFKNDLSKVPNFRTVFEPKQIRNVKKVTQFSMHIQYL